ncbi:hypothetical protein E2320_008146 [Naja naja]|nr:hypothetical protein E2320_008146 [Naja naja]
MNKNVLRNKIDGIQSAAEYVLLRKQLKSFVTLRPEDLHTHAFASYMFLSRSGIKAFPINFQDQIYTMTFSAPCVQCTSNIFMTIH